MNNIYKNLFRNLKELLNVDKCVNTLQGTLVLPILFIVYFIIVTYISKTKKIKKKQYKSLLFIIIIALPVIAFVLNIIFNKAFDINMQLCSSTIYTVTGISTVLFFLIYIIKILVERKQKKYVPLVLLILTITIFAGNFTYNKLSGNYLINYDAKSWENKWDKPQRTLNPSNKVDPYDDMAFFVGAGDAEIKEGVMKLSGRQPRLYVGVDWQNAEMEVDYKRVGTSGKGYSGCTLGIRSNIKGHSGSEKHANDTHTYYVACRHDGYIEFLKERKHGYPTADDGDRVILQKSVKHGMKKDIWYNIRYRCYNIGNMRTKLQCFINGELKAEIIDQGDEFQYNSRGIVFIRNTEIEEAYYKNFKTHEIDVSQLEDEENTGIEVSLRENQVNKNA